jgi:hypothetical protein
MLNQNSGEMMLKRNQILQIIGDLYSEMENDQMPDETVKFSVSLDGSNLAFYDAVAQHFDTTRTRLISGILDEAVMDTLLSLSDADKHSVLKKADENTNLFYENLHKDTKNYERIGGTKWLAWEESLNEKKGEKNAKS